MSGDGADRVLAKSPEAAHAARHPDHPALLLYAGLWYVALVRGDLLPAGVAMDTAQRVMTLPLTLDTELWYVERTYFGCGAIALVAAFALRQSSGGKPAIGGAWLTRAAV